jgi:hypothetical protein
VPKIFTANFMRTSFLTLCFLLLSAKDLFAQDLTKNFEIVLPKNKVENSLYKTIGFLDSRKGYKEIGVVDIGLLRNNEAKLVLKAPFDQQLTAVLNALTDSTAQDGELLFQLNRFSFAETYGTRYCYLIAGLYAKNSDGYKKIASIDTVLGFISASANLLIREESKLISGFIATNLLAVAKDSTTYTTNDIAHIDSIEMQKIPVFSREDYTDGVYMSYKSFMAQSPDKPAIVDISKDGSISSVKVTDSSGKKTKVQPKHMYALVYKGQPFIATEYGYYSLPKGSDNNFYFTGDIRVATSQAGLNAAQIGFGLVGLALAGISGDKETYVLMIDYRNGAFIHLKKVEKPAE